MKDYLWKISMGWIVVFLLSGLVFFLKIVVDFIKNASFDLAAWDF